MKNTVNTSSSQTGQGRRRSRSPVIEAQQWVRAIDSDEYQLTDRQMSVLWALAGRVNHQGCCWPPHQRLAADIKILPQRLADVKLKDASPEDAKRIENAVTSISRAVRALERRNLISIEQTTNRRGGSGNTYQLQIPALIGANDEARHDAGANSGLDPSVNPDLLVASSGLDPSVKSSNKGHNKSHSKRGGKAAAPTPAYGQTPQGMPPGEVLALWQSLVNDISGFKPTADNVKDADLLELADYLGEEMEVVVRWTIEHWPEFVKVAEDKQGAWQSPPSDPDLWYLCRYRQSALVGYKDSTQSKPNGGFGTSIFGFDDDEPKANEGFGGFKLGGFKE